MRHIADLKRSHDERYRVENEIITLCGRTSRVKHNHERDLVIAWWYGGDICRTCLRINNTNTPYGQVIRG